MITQQTQIKLTLPVQLYDFLESKARRLGLPVAEHGSTKSDASATAIKTEISTHGILN